MYFRVTVVFDKLCAATCTNIDLKSVVKSDWFQIKQAMFQALSCDLGWCFRLDRAKTGKRSHWPAMVTTSPWSNASRLGVPYGSVCLTARCALRLCVPHGSVCLPAHVQRTSRVLGVQRTSRVLGAPDSGQKTVDQTSSTHN